jgi:hypothetical protein
MEGPLEMVLHGAVVAVVVYIACKFLFKDSEAKCMTRSVAIGLVVALYMVMFGHGLPNKVNSNLF